MKATISISNGNLFSPVFKTIIGGKQVNITLKEFLENPRKYINSGISYLYENEKELRQYFAENAAVVKPEILNMATANRGTTFDSKPKQEVASDIERFLKEQLKRRERIRERFEKNKNNVTKLSNKEAAKLAAENAAKNAKK